MFFVILGIKPKRGTMELDTKSPVSDDERRLAESKKLTLEPVHADVGPDDLPDAEIAARHINEPAIANLENDTEQTAAVVQPSKGHLP
jgi:hypothetical protein